MASPVYARRRAAVLACVFEVVFSCGLCSAPRSSGPLAALAAVAASTSSFFGGTFAFGDSAPARPKPKHKYYGIALELPHKTVLVGGPRGTLARGGLPDCLFAALAALVCMRACPSGAEVGC